LLIDDGTSCAYLRAENIIAQNILGIDAPVVWFFTLFL